MATRPDFIILGAMKCATSTLHEQLAAQRGIFMSEPKEPCFFSDDEIYARGIDWYASLFVAAGPDELTGESSTHYTKLPIHPHTIERMQQHLVPHVRFIYVMRHPIDRLISQYVHEWTQRVIDGPIDEQVDAFPPLVEYSRYAMQLRPYLEIFGPDRVLPVFFERLISHPQEELERICRFLDYKGQPHWHEDRNARNVSNQRLRSSRWRDRLVYAPGISAIRRHLVPQALRDRVKVLWTMRSRPEISPAVRSRLCETFDRDLGVMGAWLGVELNCENFKQVVRERSLEWCKPPAVFAA